MTHAAGHRMYSPGHVAFSTLIGGPLAGALLIARNYDRLGRASSARNTILLALGGVVLLGVLAFNVPLAPLDRIGPILFTFAMYYLAAQLQGTDYAFHISSGGAKGSAWVALAVGAACLVAQLAVLLVVMAL